MIPKKEISHTFETDVCTWIAIQGSIIFGDIKYKTDCDNISYSITDKVFCEFCGKKIGIFQTLDNCISHKQIPNQNEKCKWFILGDESCAIPSCYSRGSDDVVDFEEGYNYCSYCGKPILLS